MTQPTILVFDNYDSFTYNLVHLIRSLGYHKVEVFRNDKIALEKIGQYDKILLSPGPGIPSEAGLLLELIKEFGPSKSIFGVCLGQQAIGEVFGGTLHNLTQVYHGLATPIQVIDEEEILFKGLPKTFNAGRYHSWVVNQEGLPNDLVVTAIDAESKIMGLRHKKYDVRGVQFHPESVLTEFGSEMLQNWLSR
jgi:anthranilate synthase component 2